MHINPTETIQQLGGNGLSSALTYCGVRRINQVQDCLFFQVNGRRGFTTMIAVRIDPNDTYTVTLSESRGALGKSKPAIYQREHDVYCDELQDVFEQMYDKHMVEHNKGFIPLS